jgi:FAD/FMN-containing dehydrogenase
MAEAQGMVDRWQSRFQGRLLGVDHESYAAARRIWNGMIDKLPRVIARCESAADVQQAVKLAREEGLPLSVRGGGHGVAGSAVCSDGVMIDLSPMRSVAVNASAREVVAAACVVG